MSEDSLGNAYPKPWSAPRAWLKRRIEIWSKGPSPWGDPRAWTRRRVRSWLKRPLRRLDMRVVDKVGFGNLHRGDFAHVLDVGVAGGTFDLYARCPSAYLELFEPHPSRRKAIEGILADRRGRVHGAALGNEPGTATLYLTGVNGSSLYPIKGKDVRVEVPVARLDEVLDATEIKRPSLLKIDTEGHEMAVLEGATGLFDVIDCVVVEVHFDKPHCYQPS